MPLKNFLKTRRELNIIKIMHGTLDNDGMFDDSDQYEDRDNVEASLSVYGTNVKVEKNTVSIFNTTTKNGPEFKQQADCIIEYLINEGYINKKKFKVKIISSSPNG